MILRMLSDTAPLCDAHPRNISATLFPGADFNNARISCVAFQGIKPVTEFEAFHCRDFNQVDHWLMQQPNRLDSARMPWRELLAQWDQLLAKLFFR